VLLTRPPLINPRRDLFARLACVRHAASVRPEPGSNSQFKSFLCSFKINTKNCWFIYISFHLFMLCLIFKDHFFLPSLKTAFVFYHLILHLSTFFYLFLNADLHCFVVLLRLYCSPSRQRNSLYHRLTHIKILNFIFDKFI
jgi:hypothetical protein